MTYARNNFFSEAEKKEQQAIININNHFKEKIQAEKNLQKIEILKQNRQEAISAELNKSGRFYDAKIYDVQTYPEFLMNRLVEPKLHLVKDGSILMKFLSSPSVLIREKEERKEEKIIYRAREEFIENRLTFLKKHIPHVIFVTGNNDLTQIEDAMFLLLQLKKELAKEIGEEKSEELISNIPLVISGLGGHGVTPGPIFASSEAAAMGHYIETFLQYKNHPKNPIFLEEKATNSGQNVAFTKPIMQKIEKSAIDRDKKYEGLRIWLVPTPTGGLRQMATVKQQAGPEYTVAEVFMLPDEKRIQEKYLKKNVKNACINFFAALRETVNHLGYMLDNDFMSPQAPDKKNMVSALLIVLKYHEILTGEILTNREKNLMIKNFIKFAKLKQKVGGLAWLKKEDIEIRDSIKKIFDPIKLYFIKTFNQVERQHMEHLGQLGLRPNQLALQQRRTKQFRESIFHFDAELPQNFSESALKKAREKQHRR